MANIKSAKKRVLVAAKKHDRNRSERASIKTRIVRVRRLVEGGEVEPVAQLRDAVSALDRASERGVLHPNNAARRKSRLMKAVAHAQALAADPEAKARAEAEAKAHAKGTAKARTAGRKAASRTTGKAK